MDVVEAAVAAASVGLVHHAELVGIEALYHSLKVEEEEKGFQKGLKKKLVYFQFADINSLARRARTTMCYR